jgi:glycosyltransferase involved in cell wall biosynthesis
VPHVVLNALLLDGRASYRSAGIHQYMLNVLQRLPEASPGWRYSALVLPEAPALPDAIRRVAVPGVAGRAGRIGWEQLQQPGVIRGLAPDLIHGMAYALPLMAHGPAVVTVYDLSFRVMPKAFPAAQRLYLTAITAASCRRARRVLTISQATRADLIRLLGVPGDQIDLAYPGVDGRFRPLPAGQVADFRARQGLPERFILYLGTLEPRKNLGALVQAFARMRSPGLHLVLAGGKGWWYDSLLRDIEALGLRDVVHLPGFVPSDDLPLWYNTADCFAYPSAFEGFGLPVLEALACGRPTVTSDASSLPEAGGAVALTVAPGSVEALANALQTALTAEAAERARALGPAHAAAFTWARTAACTVSAYQRAGLSAE